MTDLNTVGGIREDDVGGIREPQDKGGIREPEVKGGIEEVVDVERKWSVLALIKRGFWIIVVIAGFFLQRYIFAESQTCTDSGPNKCNCGEMTFDLLIDGTSIRLGPKTFSPREIKQLKTLNGSSEFTTFELFTVIDQRIRKCELEFGKLKD